MQKLLKKRIFYSLLLIFLAGLFLFWGINFEVKEKYQEYHFHSSDQVPDAGAVMILGARVHSDDVLSHMYEDRVKTALEFYQAGRAKKILVSGDHGRSDYDEVNAVKKFLLKNGVVAEDIFLDHAGFDTFDSMFRVKEIFEVKDMVIVTQKFHLPRALYLARELGLEAYGLSADRRQYLFVKRNEARESLARIKAWLNIKFDSKSKFLGEKIPISGDGQLTWD